MCCLLVWFLIALRVNYYGCGGVVLCCFVLFSVCYVGFYLIYFVFNSCLDDLLLCLELCFRWLFIVLLLGCCAPLRCGFMFVQGFLWDFV